jgi:H+/Cl- antiporter ClcA
MNKGQSPAQLQAKFSRMAAFVVGVGVLAGSASALFLVLLAWATETHGQYPFLLFFLPAAGWSIAHVYRRFGKVVEAGSNLLFTTYTTPHEKLPVRMAPLVLAGTVMTHLFGGSAGREGTAVQMGAAFAHQFTTWLKVDERERQLLIIAGVAAGFASVFGTPWAGAIFAIEVMALRRYSYDLILPAFGAAFVGDFICQTWGVSHTVYPHVAALDLNLVHLLWAALAAAIFGFGARLFTGATHQATQFFKRTFASSAHRMFVGGCAVIALWFVLPPVFGVDGSRFLGLGIPVIEAAFASELGHADFAFKILFTAITLGSGFKGGEVTPLFFVGATLGNALVWFIPLPMPLLAAMGFIGVFAGATQTPLACLAMGMELFGAEAMLFFALSVLVAFGFSGRRSIYQTQDIHPMKAHISKWFSR